MDADEFLGLLMDQLERVMDSGQGESKSKNNLKRVASISESVVSADSENSAGTNNAAPPSLLRKLFGGKLCTEIIPKASDAPRSERHEDFPVALGLP